MSWPPVHRSGDDETIEEAYSSHWNQMSGHRFDIEELREGPSEAEILAMEQAMS